MTKSFWQRVGGATVHVNRRGCTGQWTETDAKALEEIVAAVRKLQSNPAAPLPSVAGDQP